MATSDDESSSDVRRVPHVTTAPYVDHHHRPTITAAVQQRHNPHHRLAAAAATTGSEDSDLDGTGDNRPLLIDSSKEHGGIHDYEQPHQSQQQLPPQRDGRWPKARHILGLMGFLGFANVYAMRVNLSVAMVAMVNNTAIPAVQNASVTDVCPMPVPDGNSTVPNVSRQFKYLAYIGIAMV